MALNCERTRELAAGFVLGALEPAEMDAVREHLAGCRRPHPEFRELGGMVPYLAQTVEPVEPPASLRSAILSAASADLRGQRRDADAAERLVAALGAGPAVGAAMPDEQRLAVPAGIETPEAQVAASARSIGGPERPGVHATRPARSRRIVWLGRGLAAVLVVGLVAGLAVRDVVVQQQLDDQKAANDKAGEVVAAVADEKSKPAPLYLTGNATPKGLAILRPGSTLIVYLHGLEPTKGSQVYQVWLRPDGGTPKAAGSFTVNQTGQGWVELTAVPQAIVMRIEITLEPKPGAVQPSGAIAASGTISR